MMGVFNLLPIELICDSKDNFLPKNLTAVARHNLWYKCKVLKHAFLQFIYQIYQTSDVVPHDL